MPVLSSVLVPSLCSCPRRLSSSHFFTFLFLHFSVMLSLTSPVVAATVPHKTYQIGRFEMDDTSAIWPWRRGHTENSICSCKWKKPPQTPKRDTFIQSIWVESTIAIPQTTPWFAIRNMVLAANHPCSFFFSSFLLLFFFVLAFSSSKFSLHLS